MVFFRVESASLFRFPPSRGDALFSHPHASNGRGGHGPCFRRRLSTCHARAAPAAPVAELGVVRRSRTPVQSHPQPQPQLPDMNPTRFILFSLAAITFTSQLAAEPGQLPLAAKQLKQRFVADLKALQDQSTRAGRLEEALTLKQEIARIEAGAEPSPSQPASAPPFVGRWAAPGGPIDILPDRTARHGGATAKWEVVGGEVVLSWDNGWKHRYPSSVKGDTLRGREVPPRGNSGPIVLTRIRD